jgi:hypothetical protein
MTPVVQLTLASLALVLLTFAVALRLFYVRITEMRERRVHPQAASTSLEMAAKLQRVQAADNFKNLFETPVLFYALVGISIAASYTPTWLVIGSWAYVALRACHSYIHCTYNRVVHRFAVFAAGFFLLVVLWAGFVLGLLTKSLG